MDVEGILWGAAIPGIEPMVLSIGVVFAALGYDSKPNNEVPHFINRIRFMKKKIDEVLSEEEQQKLEEEQMKELEELKSYEGYIDGDIV